MSATPLPARRRRPPRPPRERDAPGDVRQGGWFVRITVLVIVVLWSIPTLGVLITSFRPEDLVEHHGVVDGVRAPVPGAPSGRSRTTGRRWTRRVRERLPEQPRGHDPLDGHPDHDRRVRRVRVLLDGVPGRYVLFVVVVGLLVVPLQMSLIPILRLYARAPTIGRSSSSPTSTSTARSSGSGSLIPAFGLPLAVYLLANYMRSLPSSIIESAKIDGADHFTIFWRLVVPLSVPALAAFAIFQFLWVWNDLLVAYVLLGGTQQNRVLTVALRNLLGSRGETWHLLTAAAFITMALPLIVFFALQRYFVRGLTAGSVKG